MKKTVERYCYQHGVRQVAKLTELDIDIQVIKLYLFLVYGISKMIILFDSFYE